eukprot:scaffold1046_cov162-Ochromonas_danica.AAC.31
MALTAAQLNPTDLEEEEEEEEETEDGFVMIPARQVSPLPLPLPLPLPCVSPSEDCAAAHFNDENPIEDPSIQTVANDFVAEEAPQAELLSASDSITPRTPPDDPLSSTETRLSPPPPPPPTAAEEVLTTESPPPPPTTRTVPSESEIGCWLSANQLDGRFEEVFQLYGLRDLLDVAVMEEEVLLDILFQSPSPSEFLPADREILLVKIAALRSEHCQRLARQEEEDAALARRLQEEEDQHTS